VPYEIVEHTADIGIRATGRTPEELFEQMAEGMFSLIVPPEEVHPQITVSIQAQAQGQERLLVAWLRELLVLFDTERILGKSFKVRRLGEAQVQGTLSGEKLDLARHHVDKEVKAVTYCDLKVVRQEDGTWVAQVIFDI